MDSDHPGKRNRDRERKLRLAAPPVLPRWADKSKISIDKYSIDCRIIMVKESQITNFKPLGSDAGLLRLSTNVAYTAQPHQPGLLGN